MASGDDIQAGRITGAESTTDLLAQTPSEGDVDFNGNIIFRVGPQLDGPTATSIPLQAIVGIGGVARVEPDSQGGAGVTGIGGISFGTGVIGRGGDRNPSALNAPGAGVLGQGSRQEPLDSTGQPHGPGMVGVAGGATGPSFEDAGSVGVFGQGGNAERRTVSLGDPPVLTVVGPKQPGPGVLGKGGTQINERGEPDFSGPGVIGLAGGRPLPPLDETGNVGVYGKGETGVYGKSDGKRDFGIGVKGTAENGTAGVFVANRGIAVIAEAFAERGGVFSSAAAAQVRLAPHDPIPAKGAEDTFSVQALIANEGLEAGLPILGQVGDLLCTQFRPSAQEDVIPVLWFCVNTGVDQTNPAQWRQVLLGHVLKGAKG